MPAAPVLSVLTVGGEPADLRGTYDSLAAQTDRRWQWCVAAEAAADLLAGAGLPLDPRVAPVLTRGPAGPADALTAATGGHLLLLRAGDRLHPQAVQAFAGRLLPGGWAYSDEAQQHGPDDDADVWAKPDYSPELLRSQPYLVRSAALPRALLLDLGGLRPEAGSAAWYDAVLRISEAAPEPVHLSGPYVVRTDPDPTGWFVPGDPAEHARAVTAHCARTGVPVRSVTPVRVQDRPVGQRVDRAPRRTPSVSIVIPTRGSASVVDGRMRCHVVELVRSLWVETRYPELEVVVVHDDVTPDRVLAELREIVGDRLVLTPFDGWFHFSRKCNAGAVAAGGEYLCFLNDDMAVVSPDWLEVMVGHLEDPGVGGVGARLLFADGSLQHVGHEYQDGHAGHPLFGSRPDTLELGAAAQVAGERSGVTAACLLVRAQDFLRVGGFSDAFSHNYNDVDLCLKLREEGFRIVCTPHAELFHYESQTRVPRILPTETDGLGRRWPVRMRRDPYIRRSRPGRASPRTTEEPAGPAGAGRRVPVASSRRGRA